MDWTSIITSIISMVSAIAVAYIGHTVKKDNVVNNNKHSDNYENISEKLNQLSTNLEVIDKRLRDEETAHLLEQKTLSKISQDLEDNDLRTLRLDLLHAIETDPENIVVILEMAQKYFVEMKGNCYMSKVFQGWANDHNVSVANLFNKEGVK